MRSSPSRSTFTRPNGISSSSSGNSSLVAAKAMLSRNITGSSSLIAVLSRPFASRGPDGTTTLSPGMREERVRRVRALGTGREPHRDCAANGDRGAHLVSADVAGLRDLVHELVERHVDHGRELDLHDRPGSGDGGPEARADEARLRDRRVADPLGAVLLDQPPVTPNGPAWTSSPIRKTRSSRSSSSSMASLSAWM